MIGPGLYDDVCTAARQSVVARGCLLVIVDGTRGNGFSCQATPEVVAALPGILRSVAEQLEADSAKISQPKN